jgi:hypothetical protein
VNRNELKALVDEFRRLTKRLATSRIVHDSKLDPTFVKRYRKPRYYPARMEGGNFEKLSAYVGKLQEEERGTAVHDVSRGTTKAGPTPQQKIAAFDAIELIIRGTLSEAGDDPSTPKDAAQPPAEPPKKKPENPPPGKGKESA